MHEPVASISNSPTLPSQSLWQMLLYAFIGGLILNIMPCVLPVIALKILGFVNEAKSSPRRVHARSAEFMPSEFCFHFSFSRPSSSE